MASENPSAELDIHLIASMIKENIEDGGLTATSSRASDKKVTVVGHHPNGNLSFTITPTHVEGCNPDNYQRNGLPDAVVAAIASDLESYGLYHTEDGYYQTKSI